MKNNNKTLYRLGGKHIPVFVSENAANDFISCWRYKIGTHKKTSIFIFIDEFIYKSFPSIITEFFSNESINIIAIEKIRAGENLKNLTFVLHYWEMFSKLNIGKDCVVVAIGGGTVSDFAGFVASTFKRGLRTIYLPTTLMSMVDAAIGGKTAINQNNIKNQIGTYHIPEFVFVDPRFLATLPQTELQSAYSEIFKISFLLKNKNLYNRLLKNNILSIPETKTIIEAIRAKVDIVRSDPEEKNKRMALNFGHTFGHAFESYFFSSERKISHGLAIAYGMQVSIFFSEYFGLLPHRLLKELSSNLVLLFGNPVFPPFPAIEPYISHDKKNSNKFLQFVLIEDFGKWTVKKLSASEVVKIYNLFIESRNGSISN